MGSNYIYLYDRCLEAKQNIKVWSSNAIDLFRISRCQMKYNYMYSRSMNDNYIEVRHSKECGRYLVAAQDIKCGQVILREMPIAHCINWGDQYARNICHNCLHLFIGGENNNINNNKDDEQTESSRLETCTKCKQISLCTDCWALSRDADDKEHSFHSDFECQQMQRLASSAMFDYDCKTLAKLALRVSDSNNSAAEQLVNNQEKFTASRLSSLNKVIKYITTTTSSSSNKDNGNNNGNNGRDLQLIQEKQQRRMLNLMCALECNTHEIGITVDEYNYCSIGSAVYEKASLFNHSCQPNVCRINRAGEWGALEMISLTDIAAGTELVYNYIQISLPTEDRQSKLSENYFFECKCNGCVNNTSISSRQKQQKQQQKQRQQKQSNSQKSFLKKYLCTRDTCNGVLITDANDANKRQSFLIHMYVVRLFKISLLVYIFRSNHY
ncbi:hypothetical protein PPL_01879 [Heterostelium album PN500]|uniref:SET domain-containing protein n=1 Tax=Heterostelium pallidum (strain ATCC 26659 / Pp 5 / PN500) TaxID=670386 RepID=D3B0R2_HETP5|nr:hypothetical protein PPL_01879 [Heterostelium album PN500]EFA84886.1 hypothetical protein PPL_01879 [Heterostelium album PN500]|eukprot:XP_020436997.1 hypothetical protein PPL_01879 [Heterostelium album PN500]